MAHAKKAAKKSVQIKRTNASASKPTGDVSHSGGRFFNRDESWMLFNRRVLEEADDATNPLLERVKFLAITSSNLDEFVEIRSAGPLQAMKEHVGGPAKPDEGGLTDEQRLLRISEMMHNFAQDQ